MTRIEGLGPKRAKALYDALKEQIAPPDPTQDLHPVIADELQAQFLQQPESSRHEDQIQSRRRQPSREHRTDSR